MIYSKQRELILDELKSCRTHPTADELYTKLRDDGPEVSLATVYRNLGQLTEAGIISRIPIPGGADRYDPVTDGHFHMLCESCGRITDIPRSAMPDIREPLGQAARCRITGYDILLYGICADCANK